jgi:hypothetical protein
MSVEQEAVEPDSNSAKFTTQAFLYEDANFGTGNTRMLLLFDDDAESETTKAQGNYKQSELSSIYWNDGVVSFYFLFNLVKL